MALESWLIKVKTAISNGVLDTVRAAAVAGAGAPKAIINPPKKKKKSGAVGILAFEVAGIMSKLLHLSQSLSDHRAIRLRNDSISLEGVRKIVSNDDAFLLRLACAETLETLRSLSRSTARICGRCDDPDYRSFRSLFDEFADSGTDPHGWAMTSCKEIESTNRKMDRYVSGTAALYREMEELASAENALRKTTSSSSQNDLSLKDQQRIFDLQQKISFKKQQIRYLKHKSLWRKTFDAVASLLAPSIFTALARIKLVYGVGNPIPSPSSLNRSLSASAVVYPNTGCEFKSIPSTNKIDPTRLDSYTELITPLPSTLGAAALSLHYANLIIVIEKMIKSPQLVGADARDDLYAMLPESIRSSLRARLRGVGFCGGDPKLAGEWRDALGRIVGWISPLAHNMIKWHGERSFEKQRGVGPTTNVLLLQTLYFADKVKTEAAITELLVGLNYVWRFEREMTAKAMFESSNFNGGVLNSQSSC